MTTLFLLFATHMTILCISQYIAKNDYKKGFMYYKEFLQKNNIIKETEKTILETLDKADKILIDLEVDRKNLFNYTKFILNRKY